MMTGSPWAVVLAGGDGERVSALTRDAGGSVVPKQFWSAGGGPPMVRWALARARRVAPASRVLVAVKAAHRAFWTEALADVPSANVLVQPENRGTAAGVLRAAVEIQTRGITTDPVVLLPADHYVADEAVLHGALAAAVRAVEQGVAPVVLLGMCPGEQQSGYGWILPASPAPFAGVRCFLEKPPEVRVRELVRDGALINSFILAARAHVLLALVGRVFPEILGSFQRLSRKLQSGTEAQELYRRLPLMDLSRDVLQHATTLLSVLRVPPCGWTDLGTAERLQRFLDRPPGQPGQLPPVPHPAAA
jgi:mannose-1-phosphate guanylyltransferase